MEKIDLSNPEHFEKYFQECRDIYFKMDKYKNFASAYEEYVKKAMLEKGEKERKEVDSWGNVHSYKCTKSVRNKVSSEKLNEACKATGTPLDFFYEQSLRKNKDIVEALQKHMPQYDIQDISDLQEVVTLKHTIKEN